MGGILKDHPVLDMEIEVVENIKKIKLLLIDDYLIADGNTFRHSKLEPQLKLHDCLFV